jgi:hypothetical protein
MDDDRTPLSDDPEYWRQWAAAARADALETSEPAQRVKLLKFVGQFE